MGKTTWNLRGTNEDGGFFLTLGDSLDDLFSTGN
jgi:hypothetical protein